MIIDAHVHLPIGKDCSILCQKREKLLQELERNHIDRCIVISDSCIESDIGNLNECVELFRECANVNVVGGISPYFEFQSQLKKIKDYLEMNLIVGIKLYTGHEAFYLSDEKLKEVYELAQQYDVPVLFHSGWDNCQYSDANVVAAVARQYPNLKLVCCHCFFPRIDKCHLLVKYPNVYFDISSIADNMAILNDIEEKIKKLIEVVPERVLFGSDYSGCDQAEHIQFVKNLRLNKMVTEAILGKNAKYVFKINE